MKPADILTRARSAVGKGCRYSLGTGGYHPADELPARPTWRRPRGKVLPVRARWLDCSGFVSWVLGRNRAVTIVPKMWGLSTDSVYADAHPTKGEHRLFLPIASPIPGCIAVFGDWVGADGKAHQGHIAIVADPDRHTVVDCSSSQDGVAEHVQEVFWSGKHRVVWCLLHHPEG